MSAATFPMIPANEILWILCSGRLRHLANQPGEVPGDRDALVGILSVARWLYAILVSRSIFTVAELTWLSHTIPVRLHSPSALPVRYLSHVSGCILGWFIRMARR